MAVRIECRGQRLPISSRAPLQSQAERQHRAVQRSEPELLTCLDESLGILDREDLETYPLPTRRVGELDDVAGYEKPFLRLRERRAEDGSNVADRLTGQSLGDLRRDQLLLDLLGRDLIERDVAERRNDVGVDLLLVERVGAPPASRLDAVLEPAPEELAQALLAGADRESERAKLACSIELTEDVLTRLAVEVPALRVEDQLTPPANFSLAPLDVALVISPPVMLAVRVTRHAASVV